eukprot:CAMPEP_0171620602 /NCGR_PEP_ID=MMETSP0990-20121206/16090_1 /TAXON_ID=483369 /ORGANISM="non described non described, Strain CCMP2098" /LENGTH=44 /DNA_ID= /DNA_START= /DNA_END= /DNA_ORIENTATION=
MEKVEEARFLTSRVEEEASLSMVLRSISLRDECPSARVMTPRKL